MLKFFYNPAYKYTNRTIIDVSSDTNYTEHNYENIDSPDTINGHIIYTLAEGESIPTYVVDDVSGWRWFVSGISQRRTGKYQISLLRDIISESPNTWKTQQAYITAGTATNYNKYKLWNLPYTNTKIKEERLNFAGESSFFVFYVNEQHINTNTITEDDLHVKYTTVPGITDVDYTVTDLTELPNYQYINAGNVYKFNTKGSVIWTRFKDGYREMSYLSGTLNGNPFTDLTIRNRNVNYVSYLYLDTNSTNVTSNNNNCETSLKTAIGNCVDTYLTTLGSSISDLQITALENYVGKTILDSSTNKVYRLNLNTNNISIQNWLSGSQVTNLMSALRSINFDGTGDVVKPSPEPWLRMNTNAVTYNYSLEELGTATGFDFTFKADVRKLPKSAVRCVNIVADSNHSNEEIAQCLMLAQTNGINPDNTTGRILDIQFLPFKIATTTDSNLKINTDPVTAQFLDFDDYQYFVNMTDLTDINKETDSIKIVSPSRANQFLFRPYNNNGNMEFTVKVTLKPYTSIIYVRPSTQGLLINDWDDKDCLIIQEDFSLTNVTSEWTQYIYNNRNYLNAFERQIQGREYERSWERQVEQAQSKADEWNARNITYQKTTTATGNVPIFSGIMGALDMAISGPDKDYMRAAQIDRAYNEALYQEGMSLSRDLFEYQLDNIKSQPAIPSKVTTIDCKFLDGVYLEYYSTNTTELNAIQNFYRYNGNRIDDYGTFDDYWGGFVRGRIIISTNYTQPEIDELNRRLSMGIFTGGIL